MIIKVVYNIEVENFQPAEKIIPNKNEGVFSLVKIFKRLNFEFFLQITKERFRHISNLLRWIWLEFGCFAL